MAITNRQLYDLHIKRHKKHGTTPVGHFSSFIDRANKMRAGEMSFKDMIEIPSVHSSSRGSTYKGEESMLGYTKKYNINYTKCYNYCKKNNIKTTDFVIKMKQGKINMVDFL